MEICNDIDFPLLSRQYANVGSGVGFRHGWLVAWAHGDSTVRGERLQYCECSGAE
jgi:hypothetical protein